MASTRLTRTRPAQFAGALLVVAALAATLGALVRPARTTTFACGALRCDPRTTYCETIKTDVPELPSDYACRPLPRACQSSAEDPPRDCKCFPPGTRGHFCASPIEDGVQCFYRATIGGR